MLTHLYHNGFCQDDLVKVYTTIVLPIHDYCSSVYHHSITAAQSMQLERLQDKALKQICGYKNSYRSLLERTDLAKLCDRRSQRADAFALRCAGGTRFSHWFPRRPHTRPTCQTQSYLEEFARCSRLWDSPLFQMRRSLNQRHAP